MKNLLPVILSAVLMGTGVVVWDLLNEVKAIKLVQVDMSKWTYRVEQNEKNIEKLIDACHKLPAYRGQSPIK